jgi:hypothetical protein
MGGNPLERRSRSRSVRRKSEQLYYNLAKRDWPDVSEKNRSYCVQLMSKSAPRGFYEGLEVCLNERSQRRLYGRRTGLFDETPTAAAEADGYPTAAQEPDSYCLGRWAVGTPTNSACIDEIQRDYDMAKFYWRDASPTVREKCVGQAGRYTDPLQLYAMLEACLETWTADENSKRTHTFHYSGD